MKKLTKTIMLLACLFGGAITADAQNHYAEFVTNVAKANAWDWGVTYKLTNPLVSGKTYVLTVDASCSDPSYTSLAFWPFKDGGATNYTGFGIDANLVNRRCEFTAADDLDRLVFNFGQMNGRLILDNIKIVEKDVEGDLLNIDFESPFDSNWDFGWNKPTAYAVVDEYNPNPNHYFKLEKTTGTANAWDRNFTCKLETPLENGETYVLTMKAKSSYYGGGDVPFWPYCEGGATLYTGIHVESDWADCTKEFTANDALNVITFKLGQMSGDFCVDDIKLVKKGTDVNLLPNGSDFEVGGRLPITGWYAEVGWQQEGYDLAQIVDGFEDFKAEAVSAEVVATDAPWYRKIEGVYTLYTSNNDGGKSYNVGSETGCYFGKYWNGENLEHYADLTNYSHIRVYQESNANMPRAFFVNAGETGHVQVGAGQWVWNASGSYYELDLAKADAAVGNRHLTSLRPTGNGTCTAVQFVDPSLQSDVAYILTGDPVNGNTDASATAALADASAKIYDATGLTNYVAANLSATNPNAIFVTTEGKLSNASNVMVGTTIANLALTDGHDFAVPAGATATAATYDRSFTAAYATVCLPFAAEFTGDAYEYTSVNASEVTFTKVEGTTLTAGKAYLVKAGFAVTGGSGALAAPVAEAFHGTYTATTAPQGAYGFSGGQFVKVGTGVTCGAFRAYLDAPAAGATLRVAFDTPTSISSLVNELNTTAVVYNEAGVRQTSLQKGLNIVKLANGKTQKVIIK